MNRSMRALTRKPKVNSMKKASIALLCVISGIMLLFPSVSAAETPNPKGINENITTASAGDNAHVISLRQLTASGRERKVKFISNLVFSDTCRIVVNNPNKEGKLQNM